MALSMLWQSLYLLLLSPHTTAQSSAAPGASRTTTYPPQFTVPSSADQGAILLPNIADPDAPVAQDLCPGYTATNVQTSSNGLTASLSLSGEVCNVYGTDIHDLLLQVEYQTDTRLHINIRPGTITPQNESWYILPTEYLPAPSQEQGTMSTSDLTFSWANSDTTGFGFNVTRTATDEVLFSTTGARLVYENQFIEFVTSQPENYNLYGLGEVIHELRLGNNFTRTIFAADVGDPIDRNLYSSHPFYLQTRYYSSDGSLLTETLNTTSSSGSFTSYSNGLYFRSAHGMEVLMNPTNVTWRTIGGSIDLYFFSGPTQPAVTQQYLDVIGKPGMQQYWTFGYHQCRWGYANWSETEEVVNSYERFGIPLETMWNDIDYMNQYRDFDNDVLRFPYDEGQEFLQRLHDGGRHYIPIIDAAIYIPDPNNETDAYPIFNDGDDRDAYLLNPDRSLYIGAVWPGYTVFPDWLTESAHEWWRDTMIEYHRKIPIDGAWIDMNECSSFCVGSCGTGNLSLNPVHPSFKLNGEPGAIVYDYPEGFNLTNATEAASASAGSSSQAAAASSSAGPSSSTSTSYLSTRPTPGIRNINYPPYVINHVQRGADLAVHAVSPNATHQNGVLEYDVHNLYGHMILQSTYDALLATVPDKRPFIIGRATMPGSGTYSGHWGGDNASKFYYMYFGIPQALSFSLFGIPMFGVDTCGFNGNSDMELCSRWIQLNAFFPFYRNHNTLSTIGQEAYRWSAVITAAKTAMSIRFNLLPYLYTLFYHAHTRGDTVMRALAWEFPNDPSLAAADRQFFLGPAMLVTPVLTQGSTTVDGVFPGLVEGTDYYYDWYNHSSIAVPDVKNTTIQAPLGHIPVYIRGGNVLAMQQSGSSILTTRDARKTGWSIVIALGVDGTARGDVYLDDGESLHPPQTKTVEFEAVLREGRVHLNVSVEGDYEGLDTELLDVRVLGVTEELQGTDVSLNGHVVARSCWDQQSGSVSVTGLKCVGAGKAWSASWEMVIG